MTPEERLNEAEDRIEALCKELNVTLESNGQNVYLVHNSFEKNDCVLKTVREINPVPF